MKTKFICPDCGADMVMRKGKHGKFFGCTRYPACMAAHGVHQTTGKPLGTPADKETRKLRIKAHDAFDKLWKGAGKHKGDRRSWAYRWLRERMGLSIAKCHIGQFDADQCLQVIEICKEIKLTDMLICTSGSSDPLDRS